ncbi:hypothetical protein DS745_03165 [Anaerobacillus alkaliphilus]|uniref:Uncharacterized protein n=1 Tax=Anaerobacillus alkaliphilus TaxID=1548597 RepID=A0A4Q0VXW3_9BACI|nr:hypothetical protein DS745_03165 [Anaerobacillus alkaliphilus]
MKIFQSKNVKLTYQITLFMFFLAIGFLIYPSKLAEFVFFMASVGAFFIVDTALSNQKKNTRIGFALVLGLTFFLVTFTIVRNSFP